MAVGYPLVAPPPSHLPPHPCYSFVYVPGPALPFTLLSVLVYIPVLVPISSLSSFTSLVPSPFPPRRHRTATGSCPRDCWLPVSATSCLHAVPDLKPLFYHDMTDCPPPPRCIYEVAHVYVCVCLLVLVISRVVQRLEGGGDVTNLFVPVLVGDCTRIAPPEDIFDQPPREMS